MERAQVQRAWVVGRVSRTRASERNTYVDVVHVDTWFSVRALLPVGAVFCSVWPRAAQQPVSLTGRRTTRDARSIVDEGDLFLIIRAPFCSFVCWAAAI